MYTRRQPLIRMSEGLADSVSAVLMHGHRSRDPHPHPRHHRRPWLPSQSPITGIPLFTRPTALGGHNQTADQLLAQSCRVHTVVCCINGSQGHFRIPQGDGWSSSWATATSSHWQDGVLDISDSRLGVTHDKPMNKKQNPPNPSQVSAPLITRPEIMTELWGRKHMLHPLIPDSNRIKDPP